MKAVCIRLTKSTWKTEDADIESLKTQLLHLLHGAGYTPTELEYRIKDIPGMDAGPSPTAPTHQ